MVTRQPKPYRIPCEVVGCARTVGAESPHRWWICPAHWAFVPKAMRRVLSRWRRRSKRFDLPLTPAERRIVARVMREAGAEPREGCRA